MKIALFITPVGIINTNAAVTALYYNPGHNGSYIAQQGGILTADSVWTFRAPQLTYDNFNAQSFYVRAETGEQIWGLSIQAPNDGLLQTGTYLATRFPFQDDTMMGFSFSVGSRGNNTSTSIVKILEIMYAPDNKTVLSAAFDAIQFEATWGDLDIDKSTTSYQYSEISYRLNSTVPLTIPEPSCMMIGSIGFALLFTGRHRR